jgi:hypothetical protein
VSRAVSAPVNVVFPPPGDSTTGKIVAADLRIGRFEVCAYERDPDVFASRASCR